MLSVLQDVQHAAGQQQVTNSYYKNHNKAASQIEPESVASW